MFFFLLSEKKINNTSCSETRADLFDYGEVVRERAEEMAARVKDEVGPTVENVRNKVVPVIEQIAGVQGSSSDRES